MHAPSKIEVEIERSTDNGKTWTKGFIHANSAVAHELRHRRYYSDGHGNIYQKKEGNNA